MTRVQYDISTAVQRRRGLEVRTATASLHTTDERGQAREAFR